MKNITDWSELDKRQYEDEMAYYAVTMLSCIGMCAAILAGCLVLQAHGIKL